MSTIQMCMWKMGDDRRYEPSIYEYEVKWTHQKVREKSNVKKQNNTSIGFNMTMRRGKKTTKNHLGTESLITPKVKVKVVIFLYIETLFGK